MEEENYFETELISVFKIVTGPGELVLGVFFWNGRRSEIHQANDKPCKTRDGMGEPQPAGRSSYCEKRTDHSGKGIMRISAARMPRSMPLKMLRKM